METNTSYFCERSAVIAGMLFALVFGGCSGGGGGGGGSGGSGAGSAGSAFIYPERLSTATSADSIGGFSSAYSATGNALTPIRLTVNGPNNYTFSVLTPQPESSFSFTVTPADKLEAFSVAGATCASCFRSRSVEASNKDVVVFIDLDLDQAGLRYSTLGLWSKPTSSAPDTQIGGALAFGVLTRGVDLPGSGTATYAGPFIGRYVDGSAVYTVGAGASAVADFGARSVDFSTHNTMRTPASGGPAAPDNGLDLSGRLTWSPGSNSVSSLPGGITTRNGVMAGDAKGAFFGPPSTTTAPFAPPEFAGAVSVTNTTGQSMVGSFALKK